LAFFATRDYKVLEQRLSHRNNISQLEYEKIFEKQDKAQEDLAKIPVLKKELTSFLRKTIGTMEGNS